MKIKTQRLLSLGLSLLNAVGVIGTFIFVAKETPKYQNAKEELPEDADKKTKFKTFVKNYKGSLIFAGASIISGMSSRVISAKTEASLIASAAMLDSSLRKYKAKIKETLGIGTDKNIVKEIMKDEYREPKEKPMDGEVLSYEEHIGYFYAKPENIWKAYTIMMKDIMAFNGYNLTQEDLPQCITIGEFLQLCKGRPLSHNLTEAKLNFGWIYEFLKQYYNKEIPLMEYDEPDENGVRMLYFMEEPIWSPADWEDYITGLISEEEYFSGSEEIDIPNRNSQFYQRFNDNLL